MRTLLVTALAGAALAGRARAGAILGVEYGGDFIHIDAWKDSIPPKNATGG